MNQIAPDHGPVITESPKEAGKKPETEADMTTNIPGPVEDPEKKAETDAKAEAEARKAKARTEARDGKKKEFSGNPSGLLLARTVKLEKTRQDGSPVFSVSDYSFKWKDENGMECTGTGRIRADSLLTKPARDNWKAAVNRLTIAGASGDVSEGALKKAAPDVSRVLELYGVDPSRRGGLKDVKHVLMSAYYNNPDGDSDCIPIVNAIEGIARRILRGRECNNAAKTRADEARKKAEEKRTENAPAVPGTIVK